MKLIGKIENVTYSGLWITRSETVPSIGSNVFNQQKKKVGKVINIIGPVERPYLLIRPTRTLSGKQLQIIGEQLYLQDKFKGMNSKGMR